MIRHDISERASKYIKGHRREHRRHYFIRGISAIVVFCTVYSLILPAISMEQKTFCELVEHRHEKGCYESRLICGYAEGAETLPDPTGADTAAPEAHVHTDACYEQVLVCEKQEHTHSLSCYSDPDADVESADGWAQSVSGVTLTEDWAEDAAAIAESQLGYSESEKNYSVAWDGVTKNGYTRYGAWYGEPYADWSALFAAFCLHYAGVPTETVPHAATCAEWISMLSARDLYTPAKNGAPVRGDLLFLDLDADEAAEHVGIVTELADGKIKAIGGDFDGRVQLLTYPADDARILGFARLPENPDADTPDATAPETTVPETTAPEATAPDAAEPLPAVSVGEAELAGDSAGKRAALLEAAALAEAGTLQNEINTIAALSNPVGTVRLTQDYTENLTIPDNTDITLDLNGHTLSPVQRVDSGTVNHITVYGTLTVTDSSTGGKLENGAGYPNVRAITVASGAHLTLLGGTITGYRVSGNGAGVRVEANGSFSMAGGTVAGNTAGSYGGGVYTYDTTHLSFAGGTITGNRAAYGGGLASYRSTTSADSPFAPAGLVLTGNRADLGGGFYACEAIYFAPAGITVAENTAQSGGGVYFARYAEMTMTDGNTIRDNTATADGGGIYFTADGSLEASRFTMTGGEICGNTAGNHGGGVSYAEVYPKTRAEVRLSGGTICENRAKVGGGLYLYRKTNFTMAGGEIADNHADTHGGGFYQDSASSGNNAIFEMTGGTICRNGIDDQTAATYGAGACIHVYSVVTLSGGSIVENTGASHGGGVYVAQNSTVTVEGGVEISRNVLSSEKYLCYGGGVHVEYSSSFTMTGGSIAENSSSGKARGVGIYLGAHDDTYTHAITGGKICGNTGSGAHAYGGGVYDSSAITIGGTAEISGNRCSADDAQGGGVLGAGSVTLCGDAAVRDNEATNYGGGVITSARLTVSDRAVISGNTAQIHGGGAYVRDFVMTGGSIADNHAVGHGGGVFIQRSLVDGFVDEMSGGEITGNTAGQYGGGICLYGHYQEANTGTVLKLTGGKIENNAAASGGGIYCYGNARVLLDGGSVTGNTAGSYGGGIYVYYQSAHTFADAPEDTAAYSLEIRAGSAISGNDAATQGRDIYVTAHWAGGIWKQPYFHADAAQTLGGSVWHDEIAHAALTGELDNRAEIQEMEQAYEADGTRPLNRYYAYTLSTHSERTAQVESTVYPTVQSAVDAVAAGTHESHTVTMLADSREDVTIPENCAVTLDLAGRTLSGLSGSVVTVQTGAELTLSDTSAAQTGTITQGRGTPTGTSSQTAGGGVYVESGAELTVTGGTLRENKATYGSAVMLRTGAEFTMTGGSITENSGSSSIVGLGIDEKDTNMRLTMTGGSITNNGTHGIYAYGAGTTLTIHGTAEKPIVISGNAGVGIVLNSHVTLDAQYLTLSGNTTAAEGGGLRVCVVSEAVLKNCTVTGNTAGIGGGIWVNSSTASLTDTVVTGNLSKGDGGGVYVQANGSSKLYLLHGAQVYGNTAETASGDLYLGVNSYVYGEEAAMGTADDTRAARNMALPDGLLYWYDATNGCYYVENGNTESQSWGVPVKTVGFGEAASSMVRENNQLPTTARLVAVPAPEASPAARIGAQEYPTLAAAVAAAEGSGEAAATIELLRDVTENVILHGGADAPDITLDLAGFTVSAPASARQVVNLYPGSRFTLADSSEGQTGALLPGAAAGAARAVYVNGADFTLLGGTIRGFDFPGVNGKGGAIYATQGSGTFGSHVTIAGGVIEDCSAYEGGAVYMYAAVTTDKWQNSFTMTGGTIRNCSATNGGGLYLYYNYSGRTAHHLVRISGGTIENCHAETNGGGIRYDGSADSAADVEIYGVTVQGCTAKNGGGIYAGGTGTESYPFRLGSDTAPTVIRDNSATAQYGGVYLTAAYNRSRTVITNVTVSGNRAGTNHGGIYAYCADMAVDGLTVADNTATGNNTGAYLNAARLNLTNSSFTGNRGGAESSAGGLGLASNTYVLPDGVADDPVLRMAHCTVSGNAAGYGAGIYLSSGKDVEFTDVTVENNTGTNYGGGIVIYQSSTGVCPTYTLKDCHITGNRGTSGGGIGTYVAYKYNLILENTEISDNRASSGGGLYVLPWSNGLVSGCSLTLRAGTRITGNTVTSDGGGICAQNIPLTIEDGVEITGNTAGNTGGGVYFVTGENVDQVADEIPFTMTGGLIAGNTAKYGGGIRLHQATHHKDLSVTITGGRIENNTANDSGGGIYATTSGGAINATGILSIPITVGGDTVITGNTASRGGGGIRFDHYCSVTLADNARITGNTAGQYGGGVYQESSATRFEQTGGLLYGNSALLGQDLYTAYSAAYRTARVSLLDAAEMSGDALTASGWLDESTDRVYQNQPVKLDPATKGYPLTLLYAMRGVAALAENLDGSYTAYELVQDAISAATGATGSVILVRDSVESVTIPAGAEITLNLNGYTLTGMGNSAITAQGVLTILDQKDASYTATHAETGESAVYAPKSGATGTITGHAAQAGGGIYVDGGAVTLQSGRISGCRAGSDSANDTYGGGGVCVLAGSFTLAGGEISENTARFGAAVMLKSSSASFVMTGGRISGNTALVTGSTTSGSGTIYNKGGTVEIYGGTISGNMSGYGGAIYTQTGKTTVSGSGVLICDNTAYNAGGAIYVNTGTVTITDATLQGNRTTAPMSTNVDTYAGYAQSAGGAIYINTGTLNITGGTRITGNTAVRGGAIAQFRGTVNIMGGTITGNTATFGGGIAQNPLPASNDVYMNLMSGCVYGNTALREVGNDLYSAYEGSADYKTQYVNKSVVPHLTVFAASNMGLDAYNVWKDDTYIGDSRTGLFIGEGQYITASISDSNNLALTADRYDTEIKTILNPDFKVAAMTVASMTDGTGGFDNGYVYNGVKYNNAAPQERFARDLLAAGEAAESSETYVYNDTVYHYISYNGRLYEQNQAVTWMPGNDAKPDNTIVRTFDSVAYMLEMTVEYGKPDEFIKDQEYVYQIWLKAILPCAADEATFTSIASLGLSGYALTSGMDAAGNEYQMLEGYWQVTTTDAASNISRPITVAVYGMADGDTLRPTFETYVVGNTENQNAPAQCASETLTVSAAPSYNVSVDYNNTLAYTGYFDLENGVEATEAAYLAAKEPGYTGSPIVYGMIQGYGVTLELYNDPTGKGLKGIELPKGAISFDLSFQGQTYMNGTPLPGGASAPYIWAYKGNDTNAYGMSLDGQSVNMNWNDADDLTQTSHYAYNAAPYNNGGGANACFNGGVWRMTGSQPAGETAETVAHVTVSGYVFDTSTYPTQNSDGKSDSTLASSAVKAFSAGYVQVLFPVDKEQITGSAGGETGYVEIAMKTAVSRLHAESLSGKTPVYEGASDLSDADKQKQLESMNGYYGYEDANDLVTNGIAVQETRYADNYSPRSTGLYIFEGGNGDTIWKENHFDKENGSTRLTNDAGTGETPIGSTAYVEGFVTFSAGTIDATDAAKSDPLYNAEFWENVEHNYMTAANILQKFDASVYTPVGAEPVVDQTYSLTSTSNTIGGGAFIISTTESGTNWSWNPYATQSYTLTILYAAKPDGTNWVESGTDGGAADMDAYREENLLYFTTLRELHAYFEAQGKVGKCVAILYQFRDCCIRSGRTLTAKAKISVTEDLEKTGDTYCTTNDVRTWTTYRPYYKLYSVLDGSEKPDGSTYSLRDITYQFNWADVSYGANALGAALPTGTVYVAGAGDNVVENADYNDTRGGFVATRPARYEDGYIKTEYSGGNKVTGTHTGALSGNTLLLYTLDTSINIGINTRAAGSNAAKTEYTITRGEREVEYRVTPGIHISSGAKNVELVTNGTQRTSIAITLTLPNGLTYQEGSMTFDYSGCDYNAGDLQWNVMPDPNDPQKIILTTSVSDIERGLPEFNFTCGIGNVMDADKDIKINGTSLTVTASIEAEYEEHNLVAAQTHTDRATILVLLDTNNGVYKGVGSQLLEVGEDIVYTLTYSDNTKSSQTNMAFADVLPYNGDSRKSEFGGGYYIKSIAIYFSGTHAEANYQTFVTSGYLAYRSGCADPADTAAEEALLTALKESGQRLTAVPDAATHTVTFAVPTGSSAILQRADADGGIALYGNMPNMRSDSRFTVTVTLSPTEPENGRALLADASGKTQSGGQTYGNDFIYVTDDSSAPAKSNAVHVSTVNRQITGMVWMDDDRDGMYETRESLLRNVDAYLYTADGEPARDVLGNEVPKCVTDENGAYCFENLAAGSYIVVFRDEGGDYKTASGTQPIEFTRLIVTSLENKQAARGNKSVAVPDAEVSYRITEAKLYTVVNMPSKEQIPSSTYISPNWNLGLYSAYGYALPMTGGSGTTLYTAGGALLIACACILLLYKKKRRKEDTASS